MIRARAADLARLEPLVAAFHHHMGIAQDAQTRRAALQPLLDECPHGRVYLAGARHDPAGYAIICFGWSVEMGGRESFVDELYVRPAHRGQGVGGALLAHSAQELRKMGVMALHLELDRSDARTRRLYERAGFDPRARYMLMTRRLT